jgi:hypothetical protein
LNAIKNAGFAGRFRQGTPMAVEGKAVGAGVICDKRSGNTPFF